MVQKKAKRSSRPARQKSADLEIPAAPMPETPARRTNWGGFRRLVILALVIFGLVQMMKQKGCSRSASVAGAPAPAAAPAAPAIQPIPAAWGKERAPKSAGKMEAPAAPMDLYVDAKGVGYALDGAAVHRIVDDKIVAVRTFGGAPNRSIAGNGRSIWISTSDNAWIAELDAQSLGDKTSFLLKDASRLLGLTWLPDEKALAAAEVGGLTIFLFNDKGRVLKKFAGATPKDGPPGFNYDLAHDSSGRLFLTDIYNGMVGVIGSDFKVQRRLTELCPSMRNRRVAVAKNKIYVPCPTHNAVLVTDMQGQIETWFEAEDPWLIRTGDDGLIYLLENGRFRKLQPL